MLARKANTKRQKKKLLTKNLTNFKKTTIAISNSKNSKNQVDQYLTNHVEKNQHLLFSKLQLQHKNIICLFKKLLFTMENATAADSSQSNISRIYIWKDKNKMIEFQQFENTNADFVERWNGETIKYNQNYPHVAFEIKLRSTNNNNINKLPMIIAKFLSFQKTTFYNGECYCSRQ